MLARRLCSQLGRVRRNAPTTRRFASDGAKNEAKAVESNLATGEKVVEEAAKTRPGFFSRHPEIFFVAGIIGIGAYIYRSSVNNSKFNDIQNEIAESTPISPFEAYELRSQNAITPEVFDAVKKQARRYFPTNKATISDFDLCLGTVLQGTALKNTHHLERVFLSLPKDDNGKINVDLLLVAFSLAVKGNVDERLRCLFELPLNTKATEETTLSKNDIQRVLGNILETFQIPSEKRVVALEDKAYPYQEYAVASPEQMYGAAVAMSVKAKTLEEADQYNLDQFAILMKSKAICIWGECYNSTSKKRMQN